MYVNLKCKILYKPRSVFLTSQFIYYRIFWIKMMWWPNYKAEWIRSPNYILEGLQHLMEVLYLINWYGYFFICIYSSSCLLEVNIILLFTPSLLGLWPAVQLFPHMIIYKYLILSWDLDVINVFHDWNLELDCKDWLQ